MFTMPHALIWNKVLPTIGKTGWMFSMNYILGYVYKLHRPADGEPEHYYSSIIAAVPETDGPNLPPAVVDYSISPFTLDGMAVTVLGDISPVHIAELGRVPIWFEPDPASFDAKCEALKAFYESQIPGVICKVR
jgi:hypothetical protein